MVRILFHVANFQFYWIKCLFLNKYLKHIIFVLIIWKYYFRNWYLDAHLTGLFLIFFTITITISGGVTEFQSTRVCVTVYMLLGRIKNNVYKLYLKSVCFYVKWHHPYSQLWKSTSLLSLLDLSLIFYKYLKSHMDVLHETRLIQKCLNCIQLFSQIND